MPTIDPMTLCDARARVLGADESLLSNSPSPLKELLRAAHDTVPRKHSFVFRLHTHKANYASRLLRLLLAYRHATKKGTKEYWIFNEACKALLEYTEGPYELTSQLSPKTLYRMRQETRIAPHIRRSFVREGTMTAEQAHRLAPFIRNTSAQDEATLAKPRAAPRPRKAIEKQPIPEHLRYLIKGRAAIGMKQGRRAIRQAQEWHDDLCEQELKMPRSRAGDIARIKRQMDIDELEKIIT